MTISIPFLNSVSVRDRAFLARQLATMLSSGIPLSESMKVLLAETRNKTVFRALEEIIKDIEGGLSFSSAIEKHPELFNKVYVAVARSGEATGRLEDVLLQMADNIEQESNIISKVRGALVYPAFILLAMIGVSVLMMVKVIPQLKHIFTEGGATLPFATRFLIAASDFILGYWWIVIALIIIVVTGAVLYFKTPGGITLINQLQATVLRSFSESLYMARFTRTMSMLVKAGIPIIEALDITGQVMNNVVYEASLEQARSQVERGIPLSTPISQNKYFPVIVSQMIHVGEQTGRLDDILAKLATYYEEEVDGRIRTISSLIEPVIIVILGLAVAFLVVAILMPIYNIAQIQ